MRKFTDTAVWATLKRLAMGLGLIVWFSSILLLSDLGHRKSASAVARAHSGVDPQSISSRHPERGPFAPRGQPQSRPGFLGHPHWHQRFGRPAHLLARFEDLRRVEQLDESTAQMLAAQ